MGLTGKIFPKSYHPLLKNQNKRSIMDTKEKGNENELEVLMSGQPNLAKLTERINATKNPKRTLAALAFLLEPRVQNIEDGIQDLEISLSEVLPGLDVTKRR